MLDANNVEVGTFWFPNNVLLQVPDGTWVQLPLSKTPTGFTSCSDGCSYYFFLDDACAGEAFLIGAPGSMMRDAMVVNDRIEYPGGTLWSHSFHSSRFDQQDCEQVNQTFEGAAMQSVPLSELHVTAPFHLAK